MCAYGLAKVLGFVRCPTQVAPEYEGGASTTVLTRNLAPAPSRRQLRRSPACGRCGLDCLAVGRERVGHRAGLFIEKPLRQPGHRCGDRRRQVGHSSETGQNVVGSNGRRHVPNNQAQYRTGLVGRPISLGVVRLRGLDGLKAHDGGTGVERPHPVLGPSLDLDGLRRDERVRGGLGLSGVDAVEPQLPDGCGEPVGEARGAGLDGLDDVEPRGERLVEELAQRVRIARFGERDLQILGFAARAGGCGIGVRHLRVRREPRRVRHGHLGAAQRTLEGALEVTVAGEPEAAALGIAQSDALHRGCGRRAFGLSLAQCSSPS